MTQPTRSRPGAAKKQLAAVAAEILFEPEVMRRCRVSRAQLYKLEAEGLFPRRNKYGMRRAGWPTLAIDLWIAIGAEAWRAKHGSREAA